MIIARFIEQHLQTYYTDIEVAIAVSVEEVEEAMPAFQPHLVLCDIELQDTKDGIELMSGFREQFPFALIFITSYQSKHIMDSAFHLAPDNYIIKPLDESRLYAGTHTAIQRIQKNKEGNQQSTLLKALTESEVQILKLIAKRFTTKQIADQLYLSPYTVKNARHRVCRKLQLEEENNALLAWTLKNQHLF